MPPERLEIAGNCVRWVHGQAPVVEAPLGSVLARLRDRFGYDALPDALPEGTRFVRRRGDTVVLVLEDHPQVRTVRWLMDDSPEAKGRGATYHTPRLAFPFVVMVVAFYRGSLTGVQELFYRTSPLRHPDDGLGRPNMLNVAPTGDHPCWLCLKALTSDLAPLPWNDKVREIREHVWGATFNRSADLLPGRASYWTAGRRLDRRVASIEAWEAATRRDPLFPLGVAWPLDGRSVGQVMASMLEAIALPEPEATADGLIRLVTECGAEIAVRSRRPRRRP
jgi:hypothetical protein